MTAHPENTRRRQELRGPRHALIGVLVVAAVLAIVTGVRTSPTAAATGMLVALAAIQLVAAGFLAGHVVRARMIALVAALFAIAWGIEQVLVLDVVTWFQLALLGIGALEALLVAGCTPRDAPKKPTPRDRPGRRR
jgi:hypothetical protein